MISRPIKYGSYVSVSCMPSYMVRITRKNHKICNRVVSLIAINMVYHLSRLEGPIENFFHKHSVGVTPFSWSRPGLFISKFIGMFTTPPIRMPRTHILSSLSIRKLLFMFWGKRLSLTPNLERSVSVSFKRKKLNLVFGTIRSLLSEPVRGIKTRAPSNLVTRLTTVSLQLFRLIYFFITYPALHVVNTTNGGMLYVNYQN